ncbi:MAG: putative porin [Vicinamibacteria bacterium]|nr:putative porin [Vicinamibacteria bacterium]
MSRFAAALMRIASIAFMTSYALADGLPRPAETPTPEATATPSPAPAMTASIPIRFFANVTLRQDFTTIQDKPDFLLPGNSIYGLLTRLRFGMEFKDTTSSVSGGLRVSAGEAPNPASPFVRLGNGFRPVTFGLDQFYVDLRPFGNKERVHAVFGKMPQPFWRGDKGVLRGEMVMDDDISPVGAALHTLLIKKDTEGQAITLENVAGYFIVEWFQQARFSGLVGDTSLWADQLKLKVRRVTLAAEYYHWQNLNSGARAPSFEPGQSASLLPGQSAFLLRSGFQITNAEVDVGSGVHIFRENEFDIFAASAQAAMPVKVPLLGKSEIVFFGQYAHNSSVLSEADGYGVSLGLVGGDLTRRLKPFSLHGTWRKVEADAALGTYADSDLGAGTDVKGFEVTGDYRIHKNLALSASFFKFDGLPNRSTRIKRTFMAIVWDF